MLILTIACITILTATSLTVIHDIVTTDIGADIDRNIETEYRVRYDMDSINNICNTSATHDNI